MVFELEIHIFNDTWTRLPDLHPISIFPYISKENKQNVYIIYLAMPIVNSDTV